MAQDPKTIGRYQVQSLLGRGGMGSVYLAMDPLLKRQVVVKVVHEGGAGFAHAMERFQREAEISARLNHPNIITVHDVGQDPNAGPFIAMEYVEGATLAGLIQQRSLSHEAGLKILVQAARGLITAAQDGIVHRDVKPENILLGKDGRVKLTDFGIARSGESNLTTVGGVFGTPSYIAPELLVDAEASPATDTYAFAVTAYELLTGTLPFKGDSVASTLLRIVNDPPVVPDSVPPAPRAVFLRALAKKPKERYPDVFSFMAALIQAYPLSGSTRAKLATLLAGEDGSLTGVPLGGAAQGRNTPLPSSQFPAPPTALSSFQDSAPLELNLPSQPAIPSGPIQAAPIQVQATPRPRTPAEPVAVAPPKPLTPPEPIEPPRAMTPPEPVPAPIPATPREDPAARQQSGPVAPPPSGYTSRTVSEPIPFPTPEFSPEPEPRHQPTPPEPFNPEPRKAGTKGGLLAVAASATGALLLLGGIYALTRGLGFGSRELSLDTNPSGAVVRIDGKEMGISPLIKVKVPKKAENLELALPGYEPKAIALLPNDRDLQVIVMKPLPGTATEEAKPADDPEIEAMRRRVRELEAQNKKEAERLKKLREPGKAPAPAPSPQPHSQPVAPQPQVPAQAPPSTPTPTPAPAPTQPITSTKPAVESQQAVNPTVLRIVSPQYPARARMTRFEPTKPHKVRIRVFVDEAGKAGKVQVVEGVSGPYGFDEAAKEAALQCTYLPGSRNGKPASGWVEIAFVFQALSK